MSSDEQVVRKRAHAIFWSWFAFGLFVIFIVVSLALLGLNAYSGLQTRDTLVDCVEPRGECFEAGQKRTATAVQSLIEANQLDEVATRRIVVIAAACSKLPDVKTIHDVEECVERQLALDKNKGGE